MALDFSLVLATIIASLSVFMKLSSGTELDMLDVIGRGELTENTQDGDLAEAADGGGDKAIPQIGSASGGKPNNSQTLPKRPAVGRKAKAVDDWEVAAKEEIHAENLAKKEADDSWDAIDGGDGNKGDERGLLKVLKALQKLKSEFDTAFYKIWA